MKKYLLPTLISLTLFSCKKESECYTAHDNYGNDIGHVCGTSENDAFNKTRGSVYNGAVIQTIEQFRATFSHDDHPQ